MAFNDVLYAARGGNVGTSDLYTVDPETGAISSIGPIGYAVTALAFDPTDGTLYGQTSNNSTTNNRSLLTIDPNTGAGTVVGALGAGTDNCADIAFLADGTLYGVGSQGGQWYSINKATGAGTPLGPELSSFGGGISANPYDDVMWRARGEGLNFYIVDAGAGTETITDIQITSGDDTPSGIGVYSAGAFDNAGKMWAVGIGTGNAAFLVKIDIVTGHETLVGSTGTSQGAGPVDALAWQLFGPRVTASAAPTSGRLPLDVNFIAASLDTVNSWAWDFGDGDTSTSQSPGFHTYEGLVGTFTATLTAEGDDGDTIVTFEITTTPFPAHGLAPCGDGLDPQTFFGVPWRSVVTTLDTETLTFLDRLASAREVTYTLGAPAVAKGSVPSYSPEVNILAGDDEPFVGFSDRLLYMFRREATSTGECWVCRFAGVLAQLSDSGTTEHATTTYNAFDPWEILKHRRIVKDDGFLIHEKSWWRTNTRGDLIVRELLDNMNGGPINEPGYVAGAPHMDAFISWSGPFFNGTVENTEVVEAIEFTRTMSVADALQKLVEGDFLEIVFTPVYDPINRPGVCVELNVYDIPSGAGAKQNDAIMAWDKPSRSLVSLSRENDGLQMVNESAVAAKVGQPTLAVASVPTMAARYGEYWWNTTELTVAEFPPVVTAIEEAWQHILQRGNQTLQVQPCAGRSPIPFLEYTLGDQLPIYASSNFREAMAPTQDGSVWLDGTLFRVYGFTISLDDNDTEKVTNLLVSTATAGS